MKTLKNIALVDDDLVYTFLSKKAIESSNLAERIDVFGNGKDAIDFIKENISNPDLMPDIIFLDISMPVMDGWQFLEEFTLLEPEIGKIIRIYVCSSSISPNDVAKVKSISAVSDYIIKPIAKEKLLALLKEM
jgi:CheY-like chemotaxis protein